MAVTASSNSVAEYMLTICTPACFKVCTGDIGARIPGLSVISSHNLFRGCARPHGTPLIPNPSQGWKDICDRGHEQHAQGEHFPTAKVTRHWRQFYRQRSRHRWWGLWRIQCNRELERGKGILPTSSIFNRHFLAWLFEPYYRTLQGDIPSHRQARLQITLAVRFSLILSIGRS